MGRTDLIEDPRFARLAERAERSDEINGIVANWTRSLPAAEVERLAIAADVPVATAYTGADISNDPHMAARGDLISVADPVIGAVKQQSPAVRFVGEQRNTPSGAPRLGEHTREVLTELAGLDSLELDRLEQAGII